MAETEIIPDTVVAPDLIEANQAANLSNAITGVFGISGGGKSALADTAVEYCADEFNQLTLCYAMDPGGFGSKRLALIRAGMLRVWDPSNHRNAFETNELISLGGWPIEILDPERGYADPDVPIVLPRALRYVLICPNGHEVAKFNTELLLNASAANPRPCPTCQQPTGLGNALRVDKQIVRHNMFKNVGLRIYDSISAMNERGLIIDLPGESARGNLPVGKGGGSLLGAADALTSGQFTYGSGSIAQVGFMQNRTYQWLTNIRNIPDQSVPAICTFGVEVSKDDDESAGILVLGPRIAGKARTAAVPGWLGNCLHAESYPDDKGQMHFRLWLTNHVDPRDPRKIPYMSKTRGVPRGLPAFLEDPWDDDPQKRAAKAWSVCSLGHLFRLLNQQAVDLTAEYEQRYKNVPTAEVEGEEILSTIVARGQVGGGAAAAAPGTVTSTTAAVAQTAPTGRGLRRPGALRLPVAPPPVATAPVVVPPSVHVAPTVAAIATVAAPVVASPVAGAAQVGAPVTPVPAPASVGTGASPVITPAQQAEKLFDRQLAEAASAVGIAPAPPPTTPPPSVPAPVPTSTQPAATSSRPIRRVPRPPTT